MQSISRTLGGTTVTKGIHAGSVCGELSFLYFSGTIVRNSSSRLSSRLATHAPIQRRLYATEAAQSAKKFSKWSMLKNGVKIGLVGGISYGCYGKRKRHRM